MTPITTTTSTTITDPAQYQASPDFPPNKEDTWPYSAQEQSGMISHRALRQELQLLDVAVASLADVELERWHLTAIRQALTHGHLARIEGRLRAEQDLLIPLLSARYHYPESLTRHQQSVMNAIQILQPLLKALVRGDVVSNDILDAWTHYAACLRALMDEKEATLFVLNRAYFSHKELKETEGFQMYARSHKWDVAALAYIMGAEAFQKEFMTREAVPSFMWYMSFQGQLAAYERELVRNCQALALGLDPNGNEFRAVAKNQPPNVNTIANDNSATQTRRRTSLAVVAVSAS